MILNDWSVGYSVLAIKVNIFGQEPSYLWPEYVAILPVCEALSSQVIQVIQSGRTSPGGTHVSSLKSNYLCYHDYYQILG
jgi:hypothetical protein